MLGIRLNVNPGEFLLLSKSLSEYQKSCTEGKKPIVDLVVKRLQEPEPIFDGMYLRTMEEALDQFSTKDSINKERYQKIKLSLQKKRENFQYANMKRLFETA